MSVALDHATYRLGGVRLQVESDDPPFLSELSATLGAPQPGSDGPAPFELAASVRAAGPRDGFAHVELETRDDELLSPAEFLLGLHSADFPFRLLPARAPWTDLALAGEDEPFFSLDRRHCHVRRTPVWRKAVALLLLQRLMRARRDAIFFHAASVAVEGRGLLLVGPKGAGKSTLALALAAGGHALLGDEQACYRPTTREILPFLRPVGIKPGPRADTVDRALQRLGRSPERDGMMRLDAGTLLPGSPAAGSAPLVALFFLDGFAPSVRLEAVQPGRLELANLQPVGSSLVNAPHTERVFQMTRMLAGARVARLVSGDADSTAQRIEEAIGRWD